MKKTEKVITFMLAAIIIALSMVMYTITWIGEHYDAVSLKKVIVMNDDGDVIAVHNGEFSIVYLNNGIRFYQGDKHYTYQNAIIEVIDYD